jgi:hypothetical protein
VLGRSGAGADRVVGPERGDGTALLGAEGRVLGSTLVVGSAREGCVGVRAAGGAASARGATLGRRSSVGATRADGRSCCCGATRAEGRSWADGATRADGRSCCCGATRAEGRSCVAGAIRPERRSPVAGASRAEGAVFVLRGEAADPVRGAAMRPDVRPTPEAWSCAIRVLAGTAAGDPARRTAIRLSAVEGFSL